MNFKVKAYSLITLSLQLCLCGPLWADETDLLWSTFLGGNRGEVSWGIAVDNSGHAYVTGTTYSSGFPTTAGAFDTTYNGSNDVFVVKLDPNGTYLEYATFLGGSSFETELSIVVDSSGHAYVTGWTYSIDFPTTVGAFDTTHNGAQDAFVAKLDDTGSSLHYATFLGGDTLDVARFITVDDSGNAYVSGSTESFDFPTTAGAFDTTHNGKRDVFVAKLNASGTALEYATFLGGGEHERGRDIAVDAAGNVYITGATQSVNFPSTHGAFDTTHNEGWDGFVAKINPSGSGLLYATYLGGSYGDWSWSIARDDSGCAYITGFTGSTDFPTTVGAFNRSFNGGSHWFGGDVFISKFNPTGSALVYSTYLGGTHDDFGYGIALDSSNNAYVTGQTASSNFPTTPKAFDATFNGGWEDGFVAKLNATGSALEYATFLGGEMQDYGWGIALDGNSYVYVTGETESDSFPTTVGAFDTTYDGAGDVFVAKLDMDVGGLAPPESTDALTIDLERGFKLIGGNIRLRWIEPPDSVEVIRYVVYRNTSPSSTSDSLAETADTTFLDVGAAGDLDTNYFYTVKAVDNAGQKWEGYNRVGEFDILMLNEPSK